MMTEIYINSVICLLCAIALLVLGLLVGCGYKKFMDKTRIEISPETNETFLVQNNKHEPDWIGKHAALVISKQAQKADRLIHHMHTHKLPNEATAKRLYDRWAKIRKNPRGLREMSLGETSAAYTVNKGEELRICVRRRGESVEFEDMNTGFLVLLHELAHLMSTSYGHGMEFKKNFAIITKIAVELNLYQYVNYAQNPTSYCDTEITHSPY
jgi:hypothetical protein